MFVDGVWCLVLVFGLSAYGVAFGGRKYGLKLASK
jgi:hypothetical protein